ncbi:hypothetical protein pb186bvf_020018, partial [Paramecium bursaria]
MDQSASRKLSRHISNVKKFINVRTTLNNQNNNNLNHKGRGQNRFEYDYILSKLSRKKDHTFEDFKFPPQVHNTIALKKEHQFLNKLMRKISKFGKHIIFKKPDEFMTGEIHLFNGIEADDVIQQNLGDCFLLGAISALAEQPDFIENIFITQQYQPNGLYGLWMVHDGQLRQVVVDDYIPCSQKGGPIFSKNQENELWVLLIEKAYAKLYGSYQSLELGGDPADALYELTGAPSLRFNKAVKDQDYTPSNCAEFILQNLQKKFILTASSFYDNKGDAYQNINNIAAGHCYSILDCQVVINKQNKMETLIKMRNPWGQGEWNGDWSDKSHLWTPQLRKQLNVQIRDDGIFWINSTDFTDNYESIIACQINPNYFHSSLKLQKDKSEMESFRTIRFTVQEEIHGYIVISFRDKRFYGENHLYSFVKIFVAEIDQNDKIINVINQTSTFETLFQGRETHLEVFLQTGRYTVLVEVIWSQSYERNLVIGFYGPVEVAFDEYDNEFTTFDNLLNQYFRLHAIQKPKELEFKRAHDVSASSIGGYGYRIKKSLKSSELTKQRYFEQSVQESQQIVELDQPSLSYAGTQESSPRSTLKSPD